MLQDISSRHGKPWSAGRSDDGSGMVISDVAHGQEEDVRKWVDVLLSDTNRHFAEQMQQHADEAQKAAESRKRQEAEAQEMTERFRQPGE